MIHAFMLLISILVIIQYSETKQARNISFEKVFEYTSLSFNSTSNLNSSLIIMPASIRFSTRGNLFMSIPRDTIDSQIIPGTFNEIDSNGTLNPWPSKEANNYNEGLLQSIVGFEIDLSNNIWLLNHKTTHCELLVFSISGELKLNYSLKDSTNSSSYLTIISLDNKNNFAFISDSQSKNLQSKIALKNYGLILLNLKTGSSWRLLGGTMEVNNTLNKLYHPVNLNTVSLRCDKRYLFYSAFMNDQLKVIRTTPLRQNQSIEEGTTFTLQKKVISEDMQSSARGHFYYTSLNDDQVYQQFYEKDFLFNNIQHIGWFSNETNKPKDLMPKSIAFNGTSGYLYVLMSRFNRNKKENLLSNSQNVNYGIYKAYVNDRSYLYECNFEEDVSLGSWVIIISLSLMMSSTVLYFINFLTSASNQQLINEKIKGYEDSGIPLVDEGQQNIKGSLLINS